MESFCSILGHVLSHTASEWIEVESEFVWGLLHPGLLSGEAGYYLTLLSSAIHYLKTVNQSEGLKKGEGIVKIILIISK